MRKLIQKFRSMGIQVAITVSFTLITTASILLLVILLYRQFAIRMETATMESSEQLLSQAVLNLEDYLRGMRRVSDAMTYTALKDTDLAYSSIDKEMNLLYQTYIDDLVSIACYDGETGELIAATPVSVARSQADVRTQSWFLQAQEEPENFHFSTPHVQNLFDNPSYKYNWVISLSRSVEITMDGNSSQGILLVDMNYSAIAKLLSKANTDESGSYLYLTDGSGEIIYHPRAALIREGIAEENNELYASYEDGAKKEKNGESQQIVTVKTVSYTGWKLIHVVPGSVYGNAMENIRYVIILLLAVLLLLVLIVNQFVSSLITRPIRLLNESVEAWEAGREDAHIYIGGSAEVEHLGRTLDEALKESQRLMQDILVEQEEKRKSELDALQSQINPHFLYNTLDSVVWMITGGRTQEAVFMVKQLASLFRISLSKGHTIISLNDEIKHAQYYMNIQKIRYKNDFQVTFDIPDEMRDSCTVKLIIQPILENAIYYGMEYMDDEGEIQVTGRREGDNIFIDIQDNGPGMPEEKAMTLLSRPSEIRSSGSGVGLVNVHNRIRLRFGEQYGLEIHAFPDEGTLVRIHMPYIPYTPEHRDQLEQARRIPAGTKQQDHPSESKTEVEA